MADNTIIEKGAIWDSMEEGRLAILRWAVNEGLSYDVTHADKKRWIAVCRTPDTCDFRIRLTYTKKFDHVKLTIFKPHTCPAATHYQWRLANSTKLLASNPLSIAAVTDDRQLKPKQLQTIESLHNGHKVKYMPAYRAKEKIQRAVHGTKADSFGLLPSLLETMKGPDNHCEYNLEVDRHKHFRRCWFIPQATINAFKYCQTFVATDETHTKGRYPMILLAITALDGNNKTLPLAWALVPSETKEDWMYFLNAIRQFFPGLLNDTTVIMSDRGKGLVPALDQIFPTAAHAFCCQHLAENVVLKWPTCRRKFWQAAYAKTKKRFDEVIQATRKDHPACAVYLRTISRDCWTRYKFPRPRYGHLISNIQESMNSHWLEARNLPVTTMLMNLWNTLMSTMYERSRQKHETLRLTDYALKYIRGEAAVAGKHSSVKSSNDIIIVCAPNGASNIVNLSERTCTCLEFQDKKLPC